MKRIFRRSAKRSWGDGSSNLEAVWQRLPAMAHRMESHLSNSFVIHRPVISDRLVDE